MGNTELLGKYEAMINELEDNGIYLTLVAYSIIDKHIKIEKKKYATECVKASLEKAGDNGDVYLDESGSYDGYYRPDCVWVDKGTITSPDNIVLV